MAITAEARSELITLVVAMFNAAPGAAVLSDLAAASEAGFSLKDIANSLAGTTQFTSIYPNFLTNQEFATKLVDSMVGTLVTPANKAAGVAELVAALNAGMSRVDVVIAAATALVSAPADDENWGAARTAFDNKVEVATYFSVELQANAADLEGLQAVIENVDDTDASVTAAKNAAAGVSTEGETFSLSVGVDTLVGTSNDDTFNALSVNAGTGAVATNLNAFDSIDGGKGTDTLNIYSADVASGAAGSNDLAASASVKNVEIINIFNEATAAANLFNTGTAQQVNASRFEGATQVWQQGTLAAAVTGLASSTTAGFKNQAATALSVTPTTTADTVSVALSGLTGANTITVGAAAGASTALKAVNISGSLGTGGTLTTTTVNTGAAQTSLAFNSAVNTTLVLGTANTVNIDASESTGRITYDGTGVTGIRTVKTGSGNDTITVNTNTSATVSSVVESGAGNDTITVNNNNAGTGTTTVNAGAGDDTITLNSVGTGKTTVNGGDGNDVVVIALAGGIDAVKTTDVIDGGAGTDTISVAGKNFDAEDYIILNEVITNFEVLRTTDAAAKIDASKLADYSAFDNRFAGTTITKVAAGQTVSSTADITVSAAGYAAPTTGNVGTLAGTLNISSVGAGSTVTANAETVNLTVSPAASNNDGNADTISTTLTGDAKTVNVTLVAKTDNAGTTTDTTDDVLEVSNFILTNADSAGNNDGLTTITLTGNGSATITNVDATALATVNASALAPVDIKGVATAGLTYSTSNAAVAETITLSSGLDDITVRNSTFSKMDTITGLTLVDNAAVAGLQVDTTKSDDLTVRSNDNSTALTGFAKATTTASSLNLALVDLAAGTADQVVFHFGGDTYVYADVNAAGAAGENILNDSDILIKLTGTIDLDLLVSALNA